MSHPLVVLARSRVAQIEYCADCNIVHVTVGPVTLRLEPRAAAQLRDTLSVALERRPNAGEDRRATDVVRPSLH